jgi:LuxR family maltose regulon positive regulatory protein
MQGHLRQAREIFWRGLQLAGVGGRHPKEGEQPTLAVSMVYQGLGEVSREQNDLENADRYLAKCIELGEQWGNAEILSDGYVLYARVRYALGDTRGAREFFRKAEQLPQDNQVSPLTTRQVDAHQARLWVAEGNVEAAARWAASLGQAYGAEDDGNGQVALFVREVEEATLARLWIAQGEFDRATDLLRPLLQKVEAAGWMGIAIDLLVLQARALQGQGKISEALNVLHRALSRAEPEGYIRVFLDEGTPMAELLRLAARNGIAVDYVRGLLAAFDREPPRSQVSGFKSAITPAPNLKPETLKPVTPPPETLFEPLSERELEVLHLIAGGLSNREIAGRLTIAVGTAKRHVSNIYAKLDVHSRVQAVARAQELGLL